jgi:carbamoyltransferase
MSNILGISAGFHDGAISLIDRQGSILFAAHSERYSKLKNDPGLSIDLLKELDSYDIDTIAYYERPWAHNLQKIKSGQRPLGPWSLDGALEQHLGSWLEKRTEKLFEPDLDIEVKWNLSSAITHRSFPHHLSHAAAGFQTSPFDSAVVVVIDAIGETDTISIYRADYDEAGQARYKKLWRRGYPHSIGLFYSAITKRVGLKPMEEEYITMGMSAYGNPLNYHYLADRFVDDMNLIRFKDNLHLGIDDKELSWMNDQDIAACAQSVTERMISNIMSRAKQLSGENNLVYMGGVALNCVANRLLGRYFDNIWIMPNPGDAGSSLGAAALVYRRRLNWKDAFLGKDIPGDYPVSDLIDRLLNDKIVGVASGRAEFGPRALGNRSLLADPRGPDIKDRVNEIKRRQQFRPFAPVILEEHLHEYFDMPRAWSNSPYMQIVASVKRPDLFPAITHIDGSARIQTVANDGSGIRKLLESWYQITGCPMLLNTSLNIRGEPMVNDRDDADRFQELYGVKVCS